MGWQRLVVSEGTVVDIQYPPGFESGVFILKNSSRDKKILKNLNVDLN
jgi:hypothetical protein